MLKKFKWLKGYRYFYRSWRRSRRKKYPEPVKNGPARQHCFLIWYLFYLNVLPLLASCWTLTATGRRFRWWSLDWGKRISGAGYQVHVVYCRGPMLSTPSYPVGTFCTCTYYVNKKCNIVFFLNIFFMSQLFFFYHIILMGTVRFCCWASQTSAR